MKQYKILILLAFLLFSFNIMVPVNLMSQQKGMYFKVETKKNVFLETNFLLYLPEGYNKNDPKEWPLLLFLHGMGESGDMLEMVKKNGPPMLIEHGKKFPFIVISPQCPDTTGWSVKVLDMLLNEMDRLYNVNKSCIFVTGLSMGGKGTWDLAYAYPDRFTAIVPVCGRTDPTKAALIKDLPVWVFHGEKDEVVPPEESISMVNALNALGSPVKFTLFPDADHDSWTDAYNDPELWEWMMGLCH